MAKKYLSVAIKQLVFERALGRCEYCKCPYHFSTEPFTLEHIRPKSKGGDNDMENLALSCFGCNLYKASRMAILDPVSLKMVSVFHPREMSWSDHFTWDETFRAILGLTAVGRATIEALRLNRKQLKNLRLALIAIGEHPPK